MGCNLDAINYWCWTHGVDIGGRDIADGRCALGAEEEDDLDYDYNDDPPEQCSACEGLGGYVDKMDTGAVGVVPCSRCNGTGKEPPLPRPPSPSPGASA